MQPATASLPTLPLRLLLLAVMGCSGGGCSGVANSLLLHPRAPRGALEGTEALAFEASSGETLELYRTRDAAPEFIVLAFTGNAGLAERTHRYVKSCLGDTPADIWALQYPGFGRSEGEATLADVAAAALDAYDHVRSRLQGPIVIYGLSLGGAVALHVAAERPGVAGLILEKPPNLRSLIVGVHGWWNLWLLAYPVAWGVPAELVAEARAKLIGVPALFMVAANDQVVPAAHVRDVFAVYRGPKRWLQLDIGHNRPFDLSKAPGGTEALRWFRKQVQLEGL